MTRSLLSCCLGLTFLAGTSGTTVAAQSAWTDQKVSLGIVHPGKETRTLLQVPAASAGRTQGRVTRVDVSVDYPSSVILQTRVCWAQTSQCVPVNGHRLDTSVFNGLDARGPVYVINTLLADRPLPAPVFVKATVVVWYASGPGS